MQNYFACMYQGGFIYQLIGRGGGEGLAKLVGKSFKQFPTPLYSNGNNHKTPIFIQHYISTPSFSPSYIREPPNLCMKAEQLSQFIQCIHVLLALMLIFNIFNSIIIYILRGNNSAGGVAGFFRF